MDSEKILRCICSRQGCWGGTEQGIPPYCQANKYLEEIKEATDEYATEETISIYKAASIVGENNNGMTPRIEEAILLARELKLVRIGFAACLSMVGEMDYLVKLFEKEGFKVFTVSCQIGRVSAEDRNVPEVKECVRSACNPIAQAKILASERTELNFALGLCIGHDILFNRYSHAPVSTLIVKDRVTGNNPAAALYGWHRRKQLFGIPLTENRAV